MSGSGTGIVTPYATHLGMRFDGVGDYYNRAAGLAGAADGTVGTLSFWYRQDADVAGTRYALFGSGGFLEVRRETTNTFRMLGLTPAAVTTLDIRTNIVMPQVLGAWEHIMCSWDLAAAAASVWLNGVQQETLVTLNNNNVDYTRPGHAFGAGVGPANLWPGAISEFYLNLAAYVDLTAPANRWLFRHPNGQPPNIGADGSSPTGAQPIVYFAEVGGAMTNLGSGGAFVAVGTPRLSANSPKDRWVASLNHWQRKRKSAA